MKARFVMKKVINGKLYNTETAELIDDYSSGLNNRDFRNITEELYRKKNGEFFLYGYGGAMTKYRERCGDMWGSGENIIPITEAEAKEWLEAHSTAETYIEIFGQPVARPKHSAHCKNSKKNFVARYVCITYLITVPPKAGKAMQYQAFLFSQKQWSGYLSSYGHTSDPSDDFTFT